MAIAKDWVPSKDADLLAFSADLTSIVSSSAATYGLTAPQTTELQGYQTEFATCLAAATNGATRGKMTVRLKNDARAQLVSFLRTIVKIIQAHPGVTDGMREELRIPIHKTTHTSVPAPTAALILEIGERVANLVGYKVHDGTGSRRGRPPLCSGYQLYAYVGPTPPATVDEWSYMGQYTRTTGEIAFDASLPVGTKVWLAACWISARGLTGVACAPVSTFIAGGNVAQPAMRLAA